MSGDKWRIRGLSDSHQVILSKDPGLLPGSQGIILLIVPWNVSSTTLSFDGPLSETGVQSSAYDLMFVESCTKSEQGSPSSISDARGFFE